VKMTRISIPVSVAERDALLENAEKNLRHPRDHARYLLRLALGLSNGEEAGPTGPTSPTPNASSDTAEAGNRAGVAAG